MWLLVTHKRPEMAKRFLDTATGSRGVMLIDEPTGEHYPEVPARWQRRIAGANNGLIHGLNVLLKEFPDEPWYGLVADDLRPECVDWSERLIKAVPMGGMVSCNDGGAPWITGRMCGACVIDGDAVRAAGFIGPPCCWHCFTDDFWEDCAKQGMPWTRLGDVVVRHHTPVGNYREKDETHLRAYGENYEVLASDRAKYNAWMAGEGNKAKRRVLDNVKRSWWKHAVGS